VARAADDMESTLGFLKAHYDANPALQTTPGSGWKPYNRVRWLLETRQAPAGVSTGRLRADAMAAGRARALTLRGTEPGWFVTGPGLAGRCIAIDFDPTNPATVYVGTAGGGLWKSTNSGATWFPLTDDLPTLGVGAVCALGSDPNVVIIGTGEGSVPRARTAPGRSGPGFSTTDAGATWNATSLGTRLCPRRFSMMEDEPTAGVIRPARTTGCTAPPIRATRGRRCRVAKLLM
jgi:hypothetical protein